MAQVLMNLVNVSVNLGDRPIFGPVSLELQTGQRLGLVGPNDSGKSTLMKTMAQEIVPEAGEIFRAPGLTWGRLPQGPLMDAAHTVIEEALTALPKIVSVEVQLDHLETRMADPAVYEDYTRLEKVLQRQACRPGWAQRRPQIHALKTTPYS